MEVIESKGANLQRSLQAEKIPSPLHCMGKSAEVIDEKGVVTAPLRKRVRIRLEIKEIEEIEEAKDEGRMRRTLGGG